MIFSRFYVSLTHFLLSKIFWLFAYFVALTKLLTRIKENFYFQKAVFVKLDEAVK